MNSVSRNGFMVFVKTIKEYKKTVKYRRIDKYQISIKKHGAYG